MCRWSYLRDNVQENEKKSIDNKRNFKSRITFILINEIMHINDFLGCDLNAGVV